MKCMQCIATNLPGSDLPSPYFVVKALKVALIEIIEDFGLCFRPF